MPSTPDVRAVLHAAVEAVGGEDRPGQIEMAEAVQHALESGEHLLVQAGTGTGKSLGYLVPSLLHGKRVVVATATLNLQHQLVERDIPALKDAARATLDVVPHHAVVKGRGNYACGLKEHIVFPEIDYDKVDQIWGMDIIVCTSAQSDDEARELLRGFNFPFRS